MRSVEKISWSEIKDEVHPLHPTLYQVIEEISDDIPDLFLVKYRYGEDIVKNGTFICEDQKYKEDLCYTHIPLLFSLNTDITSCYNIINNQEKVHYLAKKGTLFGLRNFKHNSKNEMEFLNLYAGSRGVFLDDRFSNIAFFQKLRNHYGYNFQLPVNVANHFDFFRSLCQIDPILKKWHAKIIVFPKTWLLKILNNPKYIRLYTYFLEQENDRLQWFTNSLSKYALTNQMLSYNIKSKNLKPSFYEQEIIEQILLIALGSSSGVRPITDETSFPVKRMKNILESFYESGNWAVFLHICHIGTIENYPLYLSLNTLYFVMRYEQQYKIRSNLNALSQVEYLISRLKESNDVFNRLNIKYFHTLANNEENILHPSNIQDDVLQSLYRNLDHPFKTGFWRGVIQLAIK